MRQRADQIDDRASEAAKFVTLAIADDLGVVTPADESTAISNWQARIGRPVNNEISAFFSGKKGSTAGASASAMVDSVQSSIAGKKPGETIYLSNVLRYIGFLNDGSSSQAPAGFVERSTVVGRLALERFTFFVD